MKPGMEGDEPGAWHSGGPGRVGAPALLPEQEVSFRHPHLRSHSPLHVHGACHHTGPREAGIVTIPPKQMKELRLTEV